MVTTVANSASVPLLNFNLGQNVLKIFLVKSHNLELFSNTLTKVVEKLF